ncbi:MAG: hypothetical protein CSA76_01325 [Spirochaetales bacterium]|nr:MAG: hypothetical protein CSA76_01325 [Spirochaetales bacterium]
MDSEAQLKKYWSSVLGEGGGKMAWRSVPLKPGEKHYWHAAARITGSSETISEAAVALKGPDGRIIRLPELERELVSGNINTADAVLDEVQNLVECHDDEDGSAAIKRYLAAWICADVVGRCIEGTGD